MDWTFLRDPLFWTAVGSVGTVLAFLVAFMQISVERSARKGAQIEEQARRISAWVGEDLDEDGEQTEAVLLNASSEPVFEVVAWLVMLQGAGPTRGEDDDSEDVSRYSAVGVLPPGRYITPLPGPQLWAGMHRRPGVELAFTDARGGHWIRRGDGQLEKIKADPPEHYRLGRPVDWQGAAPAAK
jgi:hypothetical protein